jgi:hypothetical protein
MSDLIQIPAPTEPRASRPLEALFRAQMRVESWENRRSWVARLIVVLSLPMAYFVWSADGRAATGARLVFLLWVFAFFGWCYTNVGLVIARRTVDEVLALAGGRHVHADPEEDRDS